MTETTLISFIEKLNNQQTENLIFLRPLSQSVDYAKVYERKPTKTDKMVAHDYPYKLYFVRNEFGTYVATVLDMSNDLHWLVLPEFRSKGLLSTALREVILYHLFQDRVEQRITIKTDEIGPENAKASRRLAIKVGFEKVSDSEYILKKDIYSTEKYFEGKNRSIGESRIDEFKKEINYVARSLAIIQTEIEMNYGESDYNDELKEVLNEIRSQVWKFEDYAFTIEESMQSATSQ